MRFGRPAVETSQRGDDGASAGDDFSKVESSGLSIQMASILGGSPLFELFVHTCRPCKLFLCAGPGQLFYILLITLGLYFSCCM